MTVAELIAELRKMPPGLPVFSYHGQWEIRQVRIRTYDGTPYAKMDDGKPCVMLGPADWANLD